MILLNPVLTNLLTDWLTGSTAADRGPPGRAGAGEDRAYRVRGAGQAATCHRHSPLREAAQQGRCLYYAVMYYTMR